MKPVHCPILLMETPIDLCYYNQNSVEIIDPNGCYREFLIELTFSDCTSIDLKVDALWHASNWGS